MNAKQFLCLLLASILVLSTISGCVQTPNAQPSNSSDPSSSPQQKVRTDIVLGEKSDVVMPDPQMQNDTQSRRVIRMLFDRLVQYDSDEQLQPMLAEKWELVTGTQYRFYLRKGVKFHNGEELKASDVKFSLERARDSSYTKAFAAGIQSVDVENDYTVLINTHQPYAPLFTTLALDHLSIVSEKAVTEAGENFKDHPIGTGPMQFKEWKVNDSYVVTRFDDYWAGTPRTTSVTVRVIPEATSRTIALENGEVDMLSEIQAVDVKRVMDNPKFTVYTLPGNAVNYISYNQTKKPFNDVRVRQALNYAIDRQKIVDTILEGYGKVLYSILPETQPNFLDKSLKAYEYNPEKAKALLTEAGYANGLKVELAVGNDERNKIAQLIQSDCQAVGVEIDILLLEWSVFLDYVARKDNFQMLILGVTGQRDPDATLMVNFHSQSGGATGNRAWYNNPAVDKLIVKASSELDQKKRIALYYELQQIISDDAVWLPLFAKDTFAITTSKAEGLELSMIEAHIVTNMVIHE